jgi:hypothetical protein
VAASTYRAVAIASLIQSPYRVQSFCIAQDRLVEIGAAKIGVGEVGTRRFTVSRCITLAAFRIYPRPAFDAASVHGDAAATFHRLSGGNLSARTMGFVVALAREAGADA